MPSKPQGYFTQEAITPFTQPRYDYEKLLMILVLWYNSFAEGPIPKRQTVFIPGTITAGLL
jgi:hypothetical protein